MPEINEFTYIGTELELFAQAKNWKRYIKILLRKYIKGNILEVGAGLGSNTRLFGNCNYEKWLCLEPDSQLSLALKNTIESNGMNNCATYQGTIDSLNDEQLFDTILYLDVLEHIENDREELIKAVAKLSLNGNLIVLSPAHQWLFTRFDAAIGHYRRYDQTMLKAILPHNVEIVQLIYVDSVGLLASLANKLLLKQSQPTLKQIKLWDNVMVPLSQKIDKILRYKLGKSIILVAKKINF